MKILFIILSSLIALFCSFVVLEPDLKEVIISKCGYWAILLIFLSWAYLALEMLYERRGQFKNLLREHRLALVVIVCLNICMHLHEPHAYKVLYDEYVINSVAKTMHEEREVGVSFKSHYVNGHIMHLAKRVDKRPYFFPFLVSTLHDFTGYRYENPYILNGFLSILILALLYALGVRILSKKCGLFLVLLYGGLPLLAQNTTGAGFELLNLSFILLLFHAALRYLDRPNTKSLNFMILTSVLLACCRYESILYTLVVAIIWLVNAFRCKKIELSRFSLFSPLLLMVPLFSQSIFHSTSGFYQTEAGNFLNIKHFVGNIEHAVFYLFDFTIMNSTSALLSVLGVVCLLFVFLLFYKFLRKESYAKGDEMIVFYAILFVVLANTLIALFSFWGEWDDPAVSRFTLPLQLFLSLSVVMTVREFSQGKDVFTRLNILAAFYFFALCIPSMTNHTMSKRLPTTWEDQWFYSWLEKNVDKTRTLVVSNGVLGLSLKGYAAVNIAHANLMPEKVFSVIDHGFYDKIIIKERRCMTIPEWEYQPNPDELSEAFITEKIAQHGVWVGTDFIISRLVGIDEEYIDEAHAKADLSDEEIRDIIEPESAIKKEDVKNDNDYKRWLLQQYP